MRNQQQTRHYSVLGFVRHEIGATVRHLIAATLLSVVLGAVLVEAVSMALNWALPTLPTHLAAGAVAVALGYAVAVTVLFRALLRGIRRGAEWVTGEVEEATERVFHDESQRVSPRSAVFATADPMAARSNSMRPATMLEDGVMAGIRSE